MREKLKKIVAYIFRSWEEEPGYTPKRFKILPPVFYEILGYMLAVFILFEILKYIIFN
jgi:hypothetical protein